MSNFPHYDPEQAEDRVFEIFCKSPRPSHLKGKKSQGFEEK
jgi:hypothetical protein